MKIYSVKDEEFRTYGRILDIDVSEVIKAAENIKMPDSGSSYIASVTEFEGTGFAEVVKNYCFGELHVQTGYCFGHSNKLNAVEWHKCSEVNAAVTDLILFLGELKDIENGRYNSENMKAFKVNKGEVIEVYSTTLHFCPIEVNRAGFGCVVCLVKGTNLPLDKPAAEKTLFRKNKWIMAHNENAELISRGVCSGVYGPNFSI